MRMTEKAKRAYRERYSSDIGLDIGLEEKREAIDFLGWHITQVVTNAGGEITIVNSEGTTIIEGKPTCRGTSVYRQYYSEFDDCVYEIQECFHKGMMRVSDKVRLTAQINRESSESTPIPEEGVAVEVIQLNDIWRT